MRKTGFKAKNGYVVVGIPRSGLFVKNGQLVRGDGAEVKTGDLILYTRDTDAQKHATSCEKYYAQGHFEYSFMVLPVLVSERP
jgi:hypothetical protein